MERIPVADAHCDLLDRRYLARRGAVSPRDHEVAPERLRRGGVALQVFAAFFNSARAQEPVAGIYRAQAQDFAVMAREYGFAVGLPDRLDADRPHALFAVEGGEAFGGSREAVQDYIDMGMRICTLTWNYENELGYPNGQVGKLKPFGLWAAQSMQRAGVGVDVSHLNQQGFWQVAELGRPFLASHSCAMALCSHRRNLTDEQIKALIQAQGYLGLNFYPWFLCGDGKAGLESVVRHALHVLDLGGGEILGIGSDFGGIEIKPDGLEGPECFPALFSALKEAGISSATLKKLAGENFLRFLHQISC